MAKLAIIAVFVVVVLLAIGEASATRTTIVIEEEDTTGRGICESQMEMGKTRNCIMFMSHNNMYDNNNEMLAANPIPQYFRKCCIELENMNKECRCPALSKMVMKMQQVAGEWQGEELQELKQMAKSLPYACGMGPHMCRF